MLKALLFDIYRPYVTRKEGGIVSLEDSVDSTTQGARRKY